ncbi:hypothetical protein [Cerasicoccus maritimus]|uniref:hypothetical protein n=1 Tax=Cerasicoccus maritimus TaxID=490089 RepID=UPI0028525160|nr:hypothetical protein [Cerasicoccus maritimus]
MPNDELYAQFIEKTACQHFVVYRRDTTPLLMLPYKRDHRGMSKFIKNFKKLVARIPDADAQDGELEEVVITWGESYYIARFFPDATSVIAVFPKDINLGLAINRFNKICLTVHADFIPV